MIKIIAELGSNPAARGWDFEPYCAAAARAGATHVKVQMFRAEHFPPGEQEVKRALEFPRGKFSYFVDAAHRRGLEAGASVFDETAVTLAVKHGDFVKRAARERKNRELIGWIHQAITLDGTAFRSSMPHYFSVSSWGYDLVWPSPGIPLFTIQQYPTLMWLAIWKVIQMPRLMRCVNQWGWSSHTRGMLDCALAARLGAAVIEKHLCLYSGEPEGGHSLMPYEFERMIALL